MAAQEYAMDEQAVTFMGTLEHLGGLYGVAGAVVVLMAAYLLLVQWLLPRGRTTRSAFQRQSQRKKTR